MTLLMLLRRSAVSRANSSLAEPEPDKSTRGTCGLMVGECRWGVEYDMLSAAQGIQHNVHALHNRWTLDLLHITPRKSAVSCDHAWWLWLSCGSVRTMLCSPLVLPLLAISSASISMPFGHAPRGYAGSPMTWGHPGVTLQPPVRSVQVRLVVDDCALSSCCAEPVAEPAAQQDQAGLAECSWCPK
jgi:hypothetical protein